MQIAHGLPPSAWTCRKGGFILHTLDDNTLIVNPACVVPALHGTLHSACWQCCPLHVSLDSGRRAGTAVHSTASSALIAPAACL